MIKKLQRQFITYATLSVIILISLLIIPINIVNYRSKSVEVQRELKYIADNGGELPHITIDDYRKYLSGESQVTASSGSSVSIPENSSAKNPQSGTDASSDSTDLFKRLRDFLQSFTDTNGNSAEKDLDLTPESNYQLRYFSVIFDESGAVSRILDDHISSLTEDEIRTLAESHAKSARKKGIFVYNGLTYSYLSEKSTEGNAILVFMDTTGEFRSVRTFARYSIMFGIFCTIAFLIIVTLISKRVVQPVARNMESQKQFITNAGHELKTPLAVISANAEVLEMIDGKNEWTTSIRNQVTRLTGLVNNLIRLAKIQETTFEDPEDVDMSAAARESVDSYRTIAEQQGISLQAEIAPDLHVTGDPRALPELVNILIDNAVKYCDDSGTISVSLKTRARGRGILLTVTNTYAEGENVRYDRFFDRFYREDTSHNSKKSGYGIGLSMANQIVENHHGKISVTYTKPDISFQVTL